MNFVLGFGDTEKRYEEKLEESIRSLVIEQYSATDLVYFTDQFVDDVTALVQAMSSDSQKTAESYRGASEHPDRYSYFWVSVVASASHLVFILKIHHVNRRHALSPDGWGMMKTERLFYVDPQEAESLGKEAA